MNNNHPNKYSVSEAGDVVRLAQRKELEQMDRKYIKPDNSDKEPIICEADLETPTCTLLCDECGAIIQKDQPKCWYCNQAFVWERWNE